MLTRIERSNNIAFGDCAMGYCGTFVKAIPCTIHTNVASLENGGRWECGYTDDE
jgi:hypothetical protein